MQSSNKNYSTHDKENVLKYLKKYSPDLDLNYIKPSIEPYYFNLSYAITVLKAHQALNKENFEVIFSFPKDARALACSLSVLSYAKITIDNDMRSLLKTIPEKSQYFSVMCNYLKEAEMFSDEIKQQVYKKVVNMPSDKVNSFSARVANTVNPEIRKQMLQNFLKDEKKQLLSTNLMQDIWQENSKIKNTNMDLIGTYVLPRTQGKKS